MNMCTKLQNQWCKQANEIKSNDLKPVIMTKIYFDFRTQVQHKSNLATHWTGDKIKHE